MLTNKKKYTRATGEDGPAPQPALSPTPSPTPVECAIESVTPEHVIVDLEHLIQDLGQDAPILPKVLQTIIQLSQTLGTIQRLKVLEKPLKAKLKLLNDLFDRLNKVEQEIAETGTLLLEPIEPTPPFSTAGKEEGFEVYHNDFDTP